MEKKAKKLKSYTDSYFYGSTINKSYFVEFGCLLMDNLINDIIQP